MVYLTKEEQTFEKLVIVLRGMRNITEAEARDILRETRWTIYDNIEYMYKQDASLNEMIECAISIFSDYTGLSGRNYIADFIDWGFVKW